MEIEKWKSELVVKQAKAEAAKAKASAKEAAAAKGETSLKAAAAAAAPGLPVPDPLPLPLKTQLEDLTEVNQGKVLAVKSTGCGTCSMCRRSAAGCLSCNWLKTLGYYLKVENCLPVAEGASSSTSGTTATISGGGEAKCLVQTSRCPNSC